MKTILLSSFIMLSSIVFAQEFPINEKTGKVSYEGIIKVEGASTTDLYIKANEWFALAFNSANNVIQMQDKDAGKIIGKGLFQVAKSGYPNGVFDFTIKFTAKEGRYMYVITDISHDKRGSDLNGSGGAIENDKPACGSMNMGKKHWEKLKEKARIELTTLSDELIKYMSANKSEDDDDW
ncbi:MAG: DUF4468 domain-containing protein [Flavobacteriales bacterium]|nr:DUF4468 domain-containing protein [Flavobacteriales bacterium]